MTSSFHLPVTLLGEEDAGQEGERTSATLLSQDCNHIFISLPFWPRYGQRESVCLRWLLAVRLSTQEGDLGSLGSLRVQYRPGGKFEEVEKAMFIWWTLFFFLCSLQCLDDVHNACPRWLTQSDCREACAFLLESDACPICIINLSLELLLKKKKGIFFRLQIFLN